MFAHFVGEKKEGWNCIAYALYVQDSVHRWFAERLGRESELRCKAVGVPWQIRDLPTLLKPRARAISTAQ
jgi:hypothetical protein